MNLKFGYFYAQCYTKHKFIHYKIIKNLPFMTCMILKVNSLECKKCFLHEKFSNMSMNSNQVDEYFIHNFEVIDNYFRRILVQTYHADTTEARQQHYLENCNMYVIKTIYTLQYRRIVFTSCKCILFQHGGLNPYMWFVG